MVVKDTKEIGDKMKKSLKHYTILYKNAVLAGRTSFSAADNTVYTATVDAVSSTSAVASFKKTLEMSVKTARGNFKKFRKTVRVLSVTHTERKVTVIPAKPPTGIFHNKLVGYSFKYNR